MERFSAFVETERVSPQSMSAEDRAAMIERIQAGEVLELPISAVFYRDVLNANAWRINPAKIEAIVAEANDRIAADVDAPMLAVDHGGGGMWDPGRADAAIGRMTAIRITTGADGVRQLEHDGVLTEPEHQVRYLRQELKRWSIGMGNVRARVCSICQVVSTSPWLDCGHWRGSTIEDGRVVEVFVDAPIAEASFVFSPAVEGTHNLSVDIGPPPRVSMGGKPAHHTDEAAAMEKQLAEFKARAEQAERERDEALATAREVAFRRAFDKAASELRVDPRDEADVRALYAAHQFDVAQLESWLARREPRPTAPRPAPADEPLAAGADLKQLDPNYWLQRQVALGLATGEEVERWTARH